MCYKGDVPDGREHRTDLESQNDLRLLAMETAMSDNNASNSWNLNLTNTKFNLVTEPWIPVIYTDGSTGTVSLETFFINADKIMALDEVEPYVEVAIFNLLLSIRDVAYARYEVDGVNTPIKSADYNTYAICEYFKKDVRWDSTLRIADLFDLYDPDHPFLQVQWDSHLLRSKEKDLYQLYLPFCTDNSSSMGARQKRMDNGNIACLFLGLRLYHLCFPAGGGKCIHIEKGTYAEKVCPYYQVSENFKKFFEHNFDANSVKGSVPVWEQDSDNLEMSDTYIPKGKTKPVYKSVPCADVLMARMYSNMLISINIAEGKFRVGANSPLDVSNLKEVPFFDDSWNVIDKTKELFLRIKGQKITLHENDDFMLVLPPQAKNGTAFIKLPEVAHLFYGAVKNLKSEDLSNLETVLETVSNMTVGFEIRVERYGNKGMASTKLDTCKRKAEEDAYRVFESYIPCLVSVESDEAQKSLTQNLFDCIFKIYRQCENDLLRLYSTPDRFSLIRFVKSDMTNPKDDIFNSEEIFQRERTFELAEPTKVHILNTKCNYDIVTTVVRDNLNAYVNNTEDRYRLVHMDQPIGLPYIRSRHGIDSIKKGIMSSERLFSKIVRKFTPDTKQHRCRRNSCGFGSLMKDIYKGLKNKTQFISYYKQYEECLNYNDIDSLIQFMDRMISVWLSQGNEPSDLPLNFEELAYSLYKVYENPRDLKLLAYDILVEFGKPVTYTLKKKSNSKRRTARKTA